MTAQPPGPNPYDPSARPHYPAYQAPGPGGVPWGPPPDHPRATTVLVLGVLGFALCQIASPFAWVIGSRVRREIQESGGRLGGQQIVAVGWVLGIVGSCILIVGALLLLAYVGVLIVAVGASA